MPYGKNFEKKINVPGGNIVNILSPPNTQQNNNEENLIDEAFNNTIDIPPIEEFAKGKSSVAISVSDGSRPNIENKVFPKLFEELKKGGINKNQIKVFIGTGAHRPASSDEIKEMFGSFTDDIKIINHNCKKSNMISLGKTSNDFPIKINKEFYNADLKIAIGTVLPHPIAGYSGGGKAIAVGVGSQEIITSIHTPEMLDHKGTGLAQTEGNPFLKAAYEIGEASGLDFIVNGVFNKNDELIDLAVGELKQAHRTLIQRTARKVFERKFEEQADIAIVSVGYPKDSNLYHLCAEGVCVVAGGSLPVNCVKKDGSIIVVSPGEEEGYNRNFYRRLKSAPPQEIVDWGLNSNEFKTGEHRAYGVASVLCDHEVIFAETKLNSKVIENAHMKHYDKFSEALDYVFARHGQDADIMIIKNSHRLIPKYIE